jgi:hypothetical protein
MQNPFWEYWYYFIPNYLLAVLVYTLIGRLLLGFFFQQDSKNYIWRFFRNVTDWWISTVRVVTPWAIGPILILPLAALWAQVIRTAFTIWLIQMGWLAIQTPGAR